MGEINPSETHVFWVIYDGPITRLNLSDPYEFEH